jgi:RNA polymerase sigma-70 factor (ECF subfamily)
VTLPAWLFGGERGHSADDAGRHALRLVASARESDSAAEPNLSGDRSQYDADRTLAARVRTGEEPAFAELFHAHYAPLTNYTATLIHDESAAEDVVQTVFVELWRRRTTFEPSTGIRAYLFSAVRYRALDRQRGERRAARYTDVFARETQTTDVDETNALRVLEQRERDAAVRAAVGALPDRAREALMLVRDHGLSYADAAAVMGVSLNTLKTQLSRAIAALRKIVGPSLVWMGTSYLLHAGR